MCRQVVPINMFLVLNDIIAVHTGSLREVPPRLEKQLLKDYAQMEERYMLARATQQVWFIPGLFSRFVFSGLFSQFVFSGLFSHFFPQFVFPVCFPRFPWFFSVCFPNMFSDIHFMHVLFCFVLPATRADVVETFSFLFATGQTDTRAHTTGQTDTRAHTTYCTPHIYTNHIHSHTHVSVLTEGILAIHIYIYTHIYTHMQVSVLTEDILTIHIYTQKYTHAHTCRCRCWPRASSRWPRRFWA